MLVSYSAHIAGAVTGLLLGTVLLRNLSASTWERATWWCSLLLFLGKDQIFSIFTEEYFLNVHQIFSRTLPRSDCVERDRNIRERRHQHSMICNSYQHSDCVKSNVKSMTDFVTKLIIVQ